MRPCVLLLLTVASISCGGGNIASQLAKPPDYAPGKCGASKSQARPLVVEWSSPDRQTLESCLRRGLVVVRYKGCEMEVLERCNVAATYTYRGTTRATDRFVVKNEDELYANLPVGAARLAGNLQRSGRLTVDTSLVGRYEADKIEVNAGELQGACEGATHFVSGATVGAFRFYAGAEASVGADATVLGLGGGARSDALRETLTENGDATACAAASPGDPSPPAQCGAIIRVEVVPLGAMKAEAPTCAAGTRWDGKVCAKVETTADEALFQHGLDQFSNSQFDRARATFFKIIKEYPTSARVPEAYYYFAVMFLNEGKLEFARKGFQQALNLESPRTDDAWIQLARVYKLEGNDLQELNTYVTACKRRGTPFACYEAGRLFLDSPIVTNKESARISALDFLKRACDGGVNDACSRLQAVTLSAPTP